MRDPLTGPPAQRRAEAARGSPGRALQPLQEVGRQIGAKPVQSVLLAAAAGAVVALLGRGVDAQKVSTQGRSSTSQVQALRSCRMTCR